VAPRAYWKGYFRLSLVSCPISLFPATTTREKISFHQHKKPGNRIKYLKVDAESGDEVKRRVKESGPDRGGRKCLVPGATTNLTPQKQNLTRLQTKPYSSSFLMIVFFSST
jgi:hypothetical protein